MNTHIYTFAALFAIAAAITSACDTDKITKCSEKLTSQAMKVTQEMTSGEGGDIDNLKKTMCDLGKSFIQCVTPATKGCGKEMDDSMEKVLQIYNNKPYNCNIKLGAGSLVATTLTIFIAALFATKFY